MALRTSFPPWLRDTDIPRISAAYKVPFIHRNHYEGDTRLLCEAPFGEYAIAPEGVVVWHEAEAWVVDALDRHIEAAYALHELMHVVCTPPKFLNEGGLSMLWEAWLVLIVERAVARSMMKKAQSEVIGYQARTSVIFDADVIAWKHPTRATFWRKGVQRAQHLGLLDAKGNPTWRRPRWAKIPDPLKDSQLAHAEVASPPIYMKLRKDSFGALFARVG